MEGRRVVMTDEIPENKKLAENQVKALVGGDDIAARRPFEMAYKFSPTHKLWLVGNHKLEVKGTDNGIWRRIHLIPWSVTITADKKRARHEVLADFSRERSGILNWAIRGILESQQLGGIVPPERVVEATKEYREESDQVGNFLAECTQKAGQDNSVSVTALRKMYASWCEENGETIRYRSTQAIKKVMRERGFAVFIDRKNQPHVVGLLPLSGEEGVLQFQA